MKKFEEFTNEETPFVGYPKGYLDKKEQEKRLKEAEIDKVYNLRRMVTNRINEMGYDELEDIFNYIYKK